MKRKKKSSINRESLTCLIISGIVALACFFPLWVAFCASISKEADLVINGYPVFIPKNANFGSYEYLIVLQGKSILRALSVTLASVVLGTAIALTVMICYGYAAAQKTEVFAFSGAISFIAWFTTIFSGGILPWYILCTRYYGLSNNIWALTLPAAMSTFHMFILRNSFKAIPTELYEAAKMDGASYARCMFTIAIPLAKVGIVTVAMFTALRFWNDFHLSLYLGTKREFFTLQKLLYNMLTSLMEMFKTTSVPMSAQIQVAPNTARMALTLLTVLPVVVVYPFAQKYLVQGVTVGAVKG